MLDTSLYHLSLAAHSRSHGHSAAAKIAYVTAERITDLWTGKVHNYRRKQGVLRVGVVGFNGTPAELARLMDEAEKRRNSTVCREGIVGLPHGLPLELRWRLLHAHAEAMAKRWGVPVIVALHAPSAKGDQRNDHGHLVFATRRIEGGKLTKKTRILDDPQTGPAEVKWLRAESTRLIGETLDAVGRGDEKPRWDHRSYAERGIAKAATQHEGVRGRALAQKQRPTRIARANRVLRELETEKTKTEKEIQHERVRTRRDERIAPSAGPQPGAGARNDRGAAAARGRISPAAPAQGEPGGVEGGDPFIEIEGELILFTEIRTIRPDEKGGIHVGPMNGRERWTSAMSARALADLVSAHYRRQAQPPPAQE